MDLMTLGLAKKYTDDSVNGTDGVLKGAPATISQIKKVKGGNDVTFSWAGEDGSKREEVMFVADGKDGGGANTLTVTVDENNIPSHTSEQILQHIQNGGTVLLFHNAQYIAFSYCKGFNEEPDIYFAEQADDYVNYLYIISGNTFTEIELLTASHDYVNETIGDISSALDELHKYAKKLTGGDNV